MRSGILSRMDRHRLQRAQDQAAALPVCLCVFGVPQRTRATVVEAVVEPWEASVNAMVAQLVPAAEIH